MSFAVADDLFEQTLDASGFSTEDLDQKGGGGAVNKEGFFHVIFHAPTQEKEEGKIPGVRVDMQVLAGTDETQVGKMIFHRIYLAKKGKSPGSLEPISDGSKKNILKFFANLGLISKEDVAGSASVRLPWERLEFFQAIVEVKNEPYPEVDKNTGNKTGKELDSFKIPYGCNVWQVGDERMAHVPKDPEALADFTGGAGVADVSDI